MNRLLYAALFCLTFLSLSPAQAQVRVLDQAEAKELVSHSKKVFETLKSQSASIEVQGRELTAKEKDQVAQNAMRMKILSDTIKLLEPYIAGKRFEYNKSNSTLINAAEEIIKRYGDGTMKPRASKITPAELELANQAKLDREARLAREKARAEMVAQMRRMQQQIADIKAEVKRANVENAVIAMESRVAEARAEHHASHAELVVARARLREIRNAQKARKLAAAALQRAEKKDNGKKGKKGKKARKKKKMRAAMAPMSDVEVAKEQSLIARTQYEIAKLEQKCAAWRVKLLNAEMRLTEMRVHLLRSKLKKFK